MLDPYQVLGLHPGASESEIRAAYDNLCRIYSNEEQNNPSMQAFVANKRRELDQAYNQLLYGGTGFQSEYTRTSGTTNDNYQSNPFGTNSKYGNSNNGFCGGSNLSDFLCALCLFDSCCGGGCC